MTYPTKTVKDWQCRGCHGLNTEDHEACSCGMPRYPPVGDGTPEVVDLKIQLLADGKLIAETSDPDKWVSCLQLILRGRNGR